jgi:hypothetical protein
VWLHSERKAIDEDLPLDLFAAQHRVRLTAQPALTCGLGPEHVQARSRPEG